MRGGRGGGEKGGRELTYVMTVVVVFWEVVSVLTCICDNVPRCTQLKSNIQGHHSDFIFFSKLQQVPIFVAEIYNIHFGCWKFVGASGYEWWFSWDVHGSLPSSCRGVVCSLVGRDAKIILQQC